MANPKIIPKKSTQSLKVPIASDLDFGEIAINHADKKLYARHPSTGVVQEISPNTGGDGSTQYLVQSDFSNPYNYIGRAIIGTDNSSSSWSIARIQVASNGSITKLNSTGSWNNRASLSYS